MSDKELKKVLLEEEYYSFEYVLKNYFDSNLESLIKLLKGEYKQRLSAWGKWQDDGDLVKGANESYIKPSKIHEAMWKDLEFDKDKVVLYGESSTDDSECRIHYISDIKFRIEDIHNLRLLEMKKEDEKSFYNNNKEIVGLISDKIFKEERIKKKPIQYIVKICVEHYLANRPIPKNETIWSEVKKADFVKKYLSTDEEIKFDENSIEKKFTKTNCDQQMSKCRKIVPDFINENY